MRCVQKAGSSATNATKRPLCCTSVTMWHFEYHGIALQYLKHRSIHHCVCTARGRGKTPNCCLLFPAVVKLRWFASLTSTHKLVPAVNYNKKQSGLRLLVPTRRHRPHTECKESSAERIDYLDLVVGDLGNWDTRDSQQHRPARPPRPNIPTDACRIPPNFHSPSKLGR